MPDEVYTHGHHDSVLRSHRWRTAQNSAAYLLPHLRAGLDVLDVGCGPGTITADLAELVSPGRVVGLDRESAPFASAEALAAERGVSGLSFETGDVYSLPYDDDTFDVVHAHQVLQHLIDPVAALREMARVTRPGGLIAARDSDYAAMTWHPADPRLTRWLALYHQVAQANQAEPDAGRHLLEWAHAAGLADVRCSAAAWCYATPDERAWWGGLWAERITASALARQAIDHGFATEAELADLAQGWLAWRDAPDAWFAVLHGEILAFT